MRRPALALTVSLCCLPTTLLGQERQDGGPGEGLKKRLLPETRWVAHFDLGAYTRSRIFEAGLEASIKNLEPEVAAKRRQLWARLHQASVWYGLGRQIEKIPQNFDYDVLVDLKSVTAFGTDDLSKTRKDVKNVILVSEVTSKGVELFRALTKLEGHIKFNIEGADLHSWFAFGAKNRKTWCYLQRGQNRSNHLIAMSENMGLLVQYAKMLQGRSPSLAAGSEGEAAIQANPSRGSIIYFEGTGGLLGLSKGKEASTIARLVRNLRGEVMEVEGKLVARASVLAESPAKARRLAHVFKGFVALSALTEVEKRRGWPKIADLVEFRSTGRQVLAEFEYDSRALVESLELELLTLPGSRSKKH